MGLGLGCDLSEDSCVQEKIERIEAGRGRLKEKMGQKRGVLEEGKLFQEFRCIHSFIHPSFHSFIHSFIYSLSLSIILSLIHALIKPFLCSFIHSFIQVSSIFPYIFSFNEFTHLLFWILRIVPFFLSEKNVPINFVT